MFKVILGDGWGVDQRKPWLVRLEGCPSSGIGAIDFRRAHGLPAEPSDLIEIPPYIGTDEAFVRANADLANNQADLDAGGAAGVQRGYVVDIINGEGRLSGPWEERGEGRRLAPEVVRKYLAAQTAQAARELLCDLWAYSARSKARAEKKLADEAQALAEARKLLKSELDALHQEIRELRQGLQDQLALDSEDDSEEWEEEKGEDEDEVTEEAPVERP